MRCPSTHPLIGQCEDVVDGHQPMHHTAKALVIGEQRWVTAGYWFSPTDLVVET